MQPIRELDKLVVHFEAEARRTDVRLAEAKERRDPPEIQAAIGDSYATANEIAKNLRSQQAQAIKAIGPRRIALARTMFDEMRSVQSTIVRLVSSLRSELHLPPDEAQFLAQMADAERRAMAALNRAFGASSEGPDAGPP